MKDTKDGHTFFKAFFEWGKNLREEELLETNFGKAIRKIKISNLLDLSATWKLLLKGGAAKVAKIPCHYCSTQSDELASFKTN